MYAPEPLRLYIGYDSRFGRDAMRVCEASVLRHATCPVSVTVLDLQWLRRIGLYQRHAYADGNAGEWKQQYDTVDSRPFSTEFSFSRFLVPSLQPDGWALFCDSDFMFRADIAQLAEHFDPRYAIQCVRHLYSPESGHKMLGQAQQPYYRKNWSSLMAFNCSHSAVHVLTPHLVNVMPGSWLHSFEWLQNPALIGDLPFEWNWLEGHDSMSIKPKAVHFTRGTPDMPGYASVPYAREWLDYWGSMHGNNKLQQPEN